MLGFDAIGRLAIGQPEQNYTVGTGHLAGVGGAGSVGAVKPTVSNGLLGDVGTGSVGIIVTNATLGFHGVGATGRAGIILTPENDVVPGVSGTGSAGTVSTALRVLTINGVQAIGSAGVVMTQSTTKVLTGVSAVGSAGIISTALQFQGIVGAHGTGGAGRITITVSGGGGKKIKTGLEPIAKRPPAPPVEIKIPTYVVPNFKPKASPALPPAVLTPFERSPGIAPLDLTGMRQQIQAAQDEADIKAVLAFLDDLD